MLLHSTFARIPIFSYSPTLPHLATVCSYDRNGLRATHFMYMYAHSLIQCHRYWKSASTTSLGQQLALLSSRQRCFFPHMITKLAVWCYIEIFVRRPLCVKKHSPPAQRNTGAQHSRSAARL